MFRKIRNEYSIMYKKITAEADKQVRIKKHPLKRKTIPTKIFFEEEEKEPITEQTVMENKPETRKSTRIQKNENKNVYKKEEKEKEIKKPILHIVKKEQPKYNNLEEELENILKLLFR